MRKMLDSFRWTCESIKSSVKVNPKHSGLVCASIQGKAEREWTVAFHAIGSPHHGFVTEYDVLLLSKKQLRATL